MSQISTKIRVQFKAGDDIRDAGLTTPENILRYDDIIYGPDFRWQRLDVYRPAEAAGQILSVIVSVHGGGWVYDDKERYQYFCMNLAQRGFAVVNFTYRLAPEYKFPAALGDTNAVFHWVLSNSTAYGFDAEKVFATGDSAGAHILGLFTALCTDSAYAAGFDFEPPVDFVPRAIGLCCGAYQPGNGGQEGDLLAEFLPSGGTKEELDQINVLHYVNEKFPPVFLMTSSADFLREEADPLKNALAHYNVPFMYRFYSDKNTDLGHVFHLNIREKNAICSNDEMCRFFREEMG